MSLNRRVCFRMRRSPSPSGTGQRSRTAKRLVRAHALLVSAVLNVLLMLLHVAASFTSTAIGVVTKNELADLTDEEVRELWCVRALLAGLVH